MATIDHRRPNPIVRWLARAACWVFYRIDRVGVPPRDGAVLLLPNHPNALLDPALVWATAERDVRFLAKSTLFAGVLRPVLLGAGAIPVYRKLDGAETSRNRETFAAVSQALAGGDAVCIFPEGISHSTGKLEPLRTGAARMALAAVREGTAVNLVPVGLNFDHKASFRSRVTVVYGKPFPARDLVSDGNPEQRGRDDSGAVRALTDRIAGEMRQLLVEADPQSDAALVNRVDALYAAARGRPSDPAERVARRRTIAAGMERLRSVDAERYAAILLRLRRYDNRLQRFGLNDRHLDWSTSRRDAATFAVRELAIAVVLAPLCLAGFVLFFIPYHLTAYVSRVFARDRDVVATAQVIGGALVYATWLAFLAWSVSLALGAIGAVAALAVLPFVALAALFAIERETAVSDAVRAWWFLQRHHRDTRERLKRRRSELADILDEVHRWLESETGV